MQIVCLGLLANAHLVQRSTGKTGVRVTTDGDELLS